jgi:hypothetical protein
MSTPAELDFFRDWLPQIIAYAELIARETDLRKAWIEGYSSRTEVYYPGELMCQIEDLTPPEVRGSIRSRLAEAPALAEAIDEFIGRIERLWAWAEANMDTDAWARARFIANAEEIFQSDAWQQLRDQARITAALALAAGYRSSDLAY